MFHKNKHSTNLQVNSRTKSPVCMNGNHHQPPVSQDFRNLLESISSLPDRISNEEEIIVFELFVHLFTFG